MYNLILLLTEKLTLVVLQYVKKIDTQFLICLKNEPSPNALYATFTFSW